MEWLELEFNLPHSLSDPIPFSTQNHHCECATCSDRASLIIPADEQCYFDVKKGPEPRDDGEKDFGGLVVIF